MLQPTSGSFLASSREISRSKKNWQEPKMCFPSFPSTKEKAINECNITCSTGVPSEENTSVRSSGVPFILDAFPPPAGRQREAFCLILGCVSQACEPRVSQGKVEKARLSVINLSRRSCLFFLSRPRHLNDFVPLSIHQRCGQ